MKNKVRTSGRKVACIPASGAIRDRLQQIIQEASRLRLLLKVAQDMESPSKIEDIDAELAKCQEAVK